MHLLLLLLLLLVTAWKPQRWAVAVPRLRCCCLHHCPAQGVLHLLRQVVLQGRQQCSSLQ
jgi:hypothetical protein